MKKILARQAAWGLESLKWSRASTAARRNEVQSGMKPIGQAPAFESDSRSFKSCAEPEIRFVNPWIQSPQTRPSAVRDPQVLMFPVRRAPRGDGEGTGVGIDSSPSLLGRARILLVEDDFIVAFDMQTMLEEQGAQVIGPASSVAQARTLLSGANPNIAVLDVNLNGELVFPLTEDLQQRGIPFVFATAYADDHRLYPASAQHAPRLAKPVLPNVLVRQLAKLLE
jgi:CheY-like chemotaxis protein